MFSAKGGSSYYNLSEDADRRLREKLKSIVYGYSLKQWLEVFWMPAAAYDPMGLVMIEVDQQGNAYPTYKSVLDVFEIETSGRSVEYVIFKLDNRISEQQKMGSGEAVYRIVDDVSDRLVKVDNGMLTEVPDQTFPNYFMKVPATIVSNIFDPVKGMFISYDDDIVELADQYLREGSVKNIFKNYFGYPQKWEYQSACPECQGQKVLNGRPCDHCKGTGIKSKSDPSETIRIPVPQDNTQPKLAPELAGYVTPDIEGWNKMTEELELLEDIMFETMWGTHQQDKTDKGGTETATGRFIDTQPVNDRLCKFSDAYEQIETFCVDLIGQFVIGQSYGGASITAGRRYMIETPDEIWLKLENARKNGAPTAALYDLYNDYLQSRYSTNAMEMQKMLKLAKIEPLPFVKYDELSMSKTFPDAILRQKYWFERWMNQKTDPEILFADVAKLQEDFKKFAEEQEKLIEAMNPSGDLNSLQAQLLAATDPAEIQRIQQQIDKLKPKPQTQTA